MRDARKMEKIEVSDNATIAKMGRALSSPTRLKILRILADKEMSNMELAEALGATEANASAQTKILLDAGLLMCQYSKGIHGLRKICSTRVNRVVINF